MARTLLEPYGMIGQPGEANYSSCCWAGVGQNPSEVRRRIDDTKRERIKRGQRDNKSSSSSRMKTQRGRRSSKDAVRWQFVARLVELCCDKNRINGTDNEKMHSWPRGESWVKPLARTATTSRPRPVCRGAAPGNPERLIKNVVFAVKGLKLKLIVARVYAKLSAI